VTTRVRNQRGEGERLRASLLDAATELLAETHDVDQLSVRGVTARAGVSPTALYLHFEDKDELIHAVKASCTDALAKALRDADEAHDGDPFEQLRAMGIAYLRFAREQPGQYAILFHTPGTDDDGDDHADAGIGAECFGLLINAVTRVVGSKNADEALEVSCVLWLALHGRASIRTKMPLPDEERFVDLVAERTFGPR
jgi:AcrR family transcriptional regulator